jgi:hypothetical protein
MPKAPDTRNSEVIEPIFVNLNLKRSKSIGFELRVLLSIRSELNSLNRCLDMNILVGRLSFSNAISFLSAP